MPTGKVQFFNADKGYGFIAPEDGGNDAFVHITAVEKAGLRTLTQDQRVTYDLENDQRGKQAAINIQQASQSVDQALSVRRRLKNGRSQGRDRVCQYV